MEYQSRDAYLAELQQRDGLPQGFRTATTSLSFLPRERGGSKALPMNLNLILLDRPTERFAAVFTRNAFVGNPVILGRGLLDEPRIQGALINNKVSNVGRPEGFQDSRDLLESLQQVLAERAGDDLGAAGAAARSSAAPLFPVSTGIIGWRLPVEDMTPAFPAMVDGLQDKSALDLARGIMTTDAFPKLRSRNLGPGRILAVAKGAGMIEPNMATMLCFIMTDLDIPRDTLRQTLKAAVDQSFNAVSVDSDQSTSDTVLAFSSAVHPWTDFGLFQQELTALCQDLARDLVFNGEGTAHVMEVTVDGAPSEELARGAAKAVVNSPLVKTAIFGNDPNVGRILGALGDFWGSRGLELDRSALRLVIGGVPVFEKGTFCMDPQKEEQLYLYFQSCSLPEKKEGFPPHERSLEISLELGTGPGRARVWGSDLSYEYVRENADYRS